MNNLTKKLRSIYLPFVLIAIGVIGGYTFLNWLLLIQLEVFHVKDFIVKFIVPVILSAICVIIWLRPRIKLLNLRTKRGGDLPGLYYVVAILSITIPTIIAQEYLDSATGKLTELDNIKQIDKFKPTKYYTLETCYIDKSRVSVIKRADVGGKHNQDLNLSIYAVCPILKGRKATKPPKIDESYRDLPLIVVDGVPVPGISMTDIPSEQVDSVRVVKGRMPVQVFGEIAKNGIVLVYTKKYADIRNSSAHTSPVPDTVKAWLGIEFHERISNRLPDNEKDQLYRQFIEQSQREFDNSDLSDFVYLKRVPYSNDLDNYRKAIQQCRLKHASEAVFTAVHEPFESRNGNKLGWIFGSFGIGSFLWLIMVLIPKLEKETVARRKRKSSKQEWLEFISFFIPKEGFFTTCIIMDLNILIFLVMVFSGLGFISFDGQDLLRWGANFKPLTGTGEWWRVLTSTFLHGGIMHVAANMYGLIFVGIFLEPRIGKMRFAWIYLACGIAGSMASLVWHDATVSVGASGAIFGMYGLFLALMLTMVFPKEFSRHMWLSTVVFVGFNLLFGLTGGIDNAAHIGGLVTGFLIGLLISEQLVNEAEGIKATKEVEKHDH